jgi:hypothetical protein
MLLAPPLMLNCGGIDLKDHIDHFLFDSPVRMFPSFIEASELQCQYCEKHVSSRGFVIYESADETYRMRAEKTAETILRSARRARAVIPGVDLTSHDGSTFLNWSICADRYQYAFRSPQISEWLFDLSGFSDRGPIGKGRYGEVKLFADSTDAKRIAVKILTIPTDSDPSIPTDKRVLREIEARIPLDHPCLLRVEGYILPLVDDDNFKIVSEYMPGGSLSSVLNLSPDWWNETAKAIVITGIVLGMRYVHAQGIIHRDLKPSNLLLDNDHRIRIGDFSSSRFENVDIDQTAKVGTAQYMAPELCGTKYDRKVDLYSFGLIAYEILAGKPVFDKSLTMPQLSLKVSSGERPAVPTAVDRKVADLIECCWGVDPKLRPTFDEILLGLISLNFRISGGVDSSAVERYVKSVRLME